RAAALPDAAASEYAKAGMESRYRAADRFLRRLAGSTGQPRVGQRVQGGVGVVPEARRGGRRLPLESAGGSARRAARGVGAAQLARAQVDGCAGVGGVRFDLTP